MQTPEDIGGFLRAERQAADMSQECLAVLTGVTQGRLSEIEKGRRSPTWSTVVRLLEGLEKRPVLDTRPLHDGPLEAAGGTVEERLEQLLLAPLVIDRLARYGARVALDGASAAFVLGVRVSTPWVNVAGPRDDLDKLARAMNDGAAAGWSEEFRDYRVRLQDEDQLDVEGPTFWFMRGFEFAVRVCDAWRPLTLQVGSRTVLVTSIADLHPGWETALVRS